MKYVYFVSYSANKNNKAIVSMGEYTLDKKIKTFEQIVSLCKTIEESTGYINIIINNYKFLRFKFF